MVLNEAKNTLLILLNLWKQDVITEDTLIL